MSDFHSFDPHLLTTGKVHGLLLSAVAPRPIAFASTTDSNGNINLAPFSFFNAFSANPPIVVFSPSRRGRDNTAKHTYLNIKEVREVVINTVSYDMVEQMSLASADFPKGTNEFKKSGLTPVPSIKVSPPRVKESPASIECKVVEVKELGHEGGAGNLIICEVEMIHVLNEFVRKDGTLRSDKMDLVGRMGESFYNRTIPESLFEIPKPASNLGIGVDALPASVRDSHILTGNELGRMGNHPDRPTELQIEQFATLYESLTREESHLKIREFLEKGDNHKAVTLAMSIKY